MSKTFRPYSPNQVLLLPPVLQDWLVKDHLVYVLGDIVDSLDLSSITSYYEREHRGYPPYHPVMMAKVWGGGSIGNCCRGYLYDSTERTLKQVQWEGQPFSQRWVYTNGKLTLVERWNVKP